MEMVRMDSSKIKVCYLSAVIIQVSYANYALYTRTDHYACTDLLCTDSAALFEPALALVLHAVPRKLIARLSPRIAEVSALNGYRRMQTTDQVVRLGLVYCKKMSQRRITSSR